MDPVLIAFILLMIVASLVAIETRNLLFSVISLGAVGFLLSMVFLFLSAPDLAITQMAVEVITLVLLLKTTTFARQDPVDERPAIGSKLIPLILVVVFGFFSVQMLGDFPEFGQPVMDRFADAPSNTYLADGFEETGAANIVTAVLLDFRAYDTLGEATVLFCAIMGALVILRRKARRNPSEPVEENEP